MRRPDENERVSASAREREGRVKRHTRNLFTTLLGATAFASIANCFGYGNTGTARDLGQQEDTDTGQH